MVEGDLEKTRIVLVETSHPGNIGAAARAMKNMGVGELFMVRPHQFPHSEATARASGADDILARAMVCDTLEEAIGDCSLVFGASARRRTLAWPELDARGAAGRSVEHGGKSAFVFGREQSGLDNRELERCNVLLHIPTNPDYSSLNLAAAVQVVCYELRMAALNGNEGGAGEPWEPAATAAEMEGFFAHLEETLLAIGFLDPANPRQLMRRLRRLYNRIDLGKGEVNILRGILKATLDRR